MTRTLILMALVLATLGCSKQRLTTSTDVSRIDVGVFLHGQTTMSTSITDKAGIESFLRDVSFGREHDLTVKHRLPGQITIWAGTNQIGHANFEGRLLRWNKREWYMSGRTVRMLEQIITNGGSNQASQTIGAEAAPQPEH